MRLYIIPFDFDPALNFGSLHEKIKSSPEIKNWWHYLKSAYVVASESEANQLYEILKDYMPTRRYLIIEVRPENKQGLLPKDAWEWLNRYRR